MDNSIKRIIISNLISDLNETVISLGKAILYIDIYSEKGLELHNMQVINLDEINFDGNMLNIIGGDSYFKLDITDYDIGYDDDVEEYILKNNHKTIYISTVKGSENFS